MSRILKEGLLDAGQLTIGACRDGWRLTITRLPEKIGLELA